MPLITRQRNVTHITLYYDVLTPDITTSAPETVLLLHGFAGTPEHDFAGLLPQLRQHYQVLALHLYGYGQSSRRTSYTLNYYREDVEDIIALLNALGLPRVLVLAFSDGGIVSLLLAALHPQRVQALAVMGAQPSVSAQDAAAIRHWLLERPLSVDWQQELTDLYGETYWQSLLPLYVKAQEDLVRAGGVLITHEELQSIRCPTLIMHGQRDRVVPVHYAHQLHEQIPSSQLLLFDAGHAAHLRCEEDYKAAVMKFFHQHNALSSFL